jgi:hypothetical protein
MEILTKEEVINEWKSLKKSLENITSNNISSKAKRIINLHSNLKRYRISLSNYRDGYIDENLKEITEICIEYDNLINTINNVDFASFPLINEDSNGLNYKSIIRNMASFSKYYEEEDKKFRISNNGKEEDITDLFKKSVKKDIYKKKTNYRTIFRKSKKKRTNI